MAVAQRLRSLPEALKPERFETPAILKKLVRANRSLAELKGVAAPVTGYLVEALEEDA